jgi:hypothetical protein
MSGRVRREGWEVCGSEATQPSNQAGATGKIEAAAAEVGVLQMAAYLVLKPIFEADFHPHSFGFRPKRNAHQALEAIVEALRSGRTEVLEADLSKYFDTIPHRQLLRTVARRISDGSVLRLIKQWLRARGGRRPGRHAARPAQPGGHTARGRYLTAPCQPVSEPTGLGGQ